MRFASVALLAALGAASCDEPDRRFYQTHANVDSCEHALEVPWEAVGACTMLMNRVDDQLMDAPRARIHRGDAFAEMEEYEHAKVDYRWVLAHAPNHKSAKRAREKLAQIEEDDKSRAEAAK